MGVIPSIVFVLMMAKLSGLPSDVTHTLVSGTLIGMGASTLLQAWGGRWGSGLLLIHCADPIMIGLGAAAVRWGGAGALVELTVLSSLTAVCIGPLLPSLRSWFPPCVVGTVVFMVGVSLLPDAVRHAWGADINMRLTGDDTALSLIMLSTIVVVSVWGNRRLKLYAVGISLLTGLIAAAFWGKIGDVHQLNQVQWIASPRLLIPNFSLPPALVGAIILTSILNQLDNLGGAVMVDKMTNANWRRADLRVVTGTMRANGIGDICGALFGALPTLQSSQNIAITSISQASSRYIGLAVGSSLILMAFLPKVSALIMMIPAALQGTLSLYASVFLMTSGIEMISSRALDEKSIFTVGLSIAGGIAVMTLPGIHQNLPENLQFIAESGFVTAGTLVLLLNALFRIGVQQSAELSLPNSETPLALQVQEFLERSGSVWGARRDVLARAIEAANEGIELLAASGSRKPIAIRATFDEFNLDIDILHTGNRLPVRVEPPTAWSGNSASFAIETIDVEATILEAGARLLSHLSDRVSSSAGTAGGEPARLTLHLSH